MRQPLGISEVKAKLAAICDRAAHGEVIRFTRRRGSQVESFELRRVSGGKRQLGVWQDKLTDTDLVELTAPLSEEEQALWNI